MLRRQIALRTKRNKRKRKYYNIKGVICENIEISFVQKSYRQSKDPLSIRTIACKLDY